MGVTIERMPHRIGLLPFFEAILPKHTAIYKIRTKIMI